MASIEEYRKAVEYLATQKRDFDIHNEGDEYAKVIFTNLFLNARKTLRIAANSLRNSVVDSTEYLDALDSFLGRDGTTLQIIISHLPENASEDSTLNIYRRLRLNPAYSQGRIHIKNAKRCIFRIGDTPANFCVADGLMYRIENNIERRTALCNFGNSSRAKLLEERFDEGYNSIEQELDLSLVFA